MKYLMGIDLGTSSVKTIVMDYSGTIIAIASEEYPINTPMKGYAEQHPEIWWEATVKTIQRVLQKPNVDKHLIKSIGLSGQMHGMVLIDKTGSVIRPAIIWCDQRSKSQVDELYNKIGKDELGQLTLNPIATGFQTASLMWIKENEPEIYERTYKVILPKDYIRLKLTGEIYTDITDASSTLAFNTSKKEWATNLIKNIGLDIEKYPKCGAPTDIAGSVTENASRQTGLMQGTTVVYGGGDQPMQAVGNGIVTPGTISSTIGTGGQIFTPINEPIYDKLLRTHTFCNAVNGTWNIMGASLCAGLSLRWFSENVIKDSDFKKIDCEAMKLLPGCEGLLFLPYLTGERTPHMDPNARGVFFGLSLRHSYVHMARAIMEGVVFALKDSLEIFGSLGIKADRIIASGGGTKSKLWLQIQSDIFGREVYTTKTTEQACVGAAIVAGVGCGIYSDVQEACNIVVRLNEDITLPSKENSSAYEHYYSIYKELYKRNKDLFSLL